MQTLSKDEMLSIKGGETISRQITLGKNNYTFQIDTTKREICVARIIAPANPFQAPPRPIPYCFKY